MAEPAYDLFHDSDPPPWPEQGSWTWNDYLRLPEDGQRYEIIHGVLYVSPAPRFLHQFVQGRLFYYLSRFVLEGHFGVVLSAPFDVLLPEIASPVQPDILYLRNENVPDVEATNFEGVPDLVVEVLSPRTRRIDLEVKLGAYEEAGVPEYWIVDPEERRVRVYRFDEACHEYGEAGCFGAGEVVRSEVLAGLEVSVSDLFPG